MTAIAVKILGAVTPTDGSTENETAGAVGAQAQPSPRMSVHT
jgi:hypothetical protein